MPSAETIKIVSTTKIIFEANGNARCWIPVEKGQYLAVDSTATAYTSESNHVPYMLYDQANETLECRGFGSAGSIEPVDPYSLALEYKLEYDMDDTGLVKQIDANREDVASLKEDLADVAEVNYHVNICDNTKLEDGYVNWKDGSIMPHATYKHSDFIPVKRGVTYLIKLPNNAHFCFFYTSKEVYQNTKGNDIKAFDGGTIRCMSSNTNGSYFVSPVDGFVRMTCNSPFVFVAVHSIDEDTFDIDDTDFNHVCAIVPKGVSDNRVNIERNRNAIERNEASVTEVKNKTDTLYGKFYDLSNLADPSKFLVGIIDSNNNIFPSATGYLTNDYIFVKAGETITSNYELRRAIALDADKNKKVWYSEDTTEYTAEVDSWFRASLYVNASFKPRKTSWMLNYGTKSLPFVPYHKEIIYAEARKKIVISVKDGIQSFYDKMLDAYNTTNCDVYIENGTYIYTNELIDAIRASGRRGIPIGNGCRYYFESGAFIYCEYTGQNKSDVCNMFSPLDSWNVGTDFEIENLHIVSKNTVYALHDESSGATNHVRHRYKNCYIELDNTGIPDETTYISKALGGGLGQYTDICIENCVFIGTNPYNSNSVGNDASYHGPNNSDVSHNRITVVNSWFKGNFRTSNLGTETDVKCDLTYSGCSSSSPVSFPDNWNVKAFCNEVRS